MRIKKLLKRKQQQHSQPVKGSSPNVPVPPGEEEKNVKPYKFSPFQVSTSNKVDYALARVDDLLNFIRRV